MSLDVATVASAMRATALARAAAAAEDAAAAIALAARMAEYAATGRGEPPTASQLAALARATGARDSGTDDASRVIRAARARSRIYRGQSVACADLAAAAGVSRQYAHREWGTIVRAEVARSLLSREADR